MTTFLGSIFERVAGEVLVRFLKPSNIKARLNTIEAYCVYYPVYVSITRLERTSLDLVERFIESLKEDPALLVRILLEISSIGPSEPSVKSQIRERFRNDANVLYLPEPYYKDLAADVEDDISKLLNLVKERDLESASRNAEEKFKKKYSEGDLQVPGIEEVVEEALILVLATLRFKKSVNATIIKPVMYYYSLLTLERSFEKVPIALMTFISSIVPPESLPSTLPEYLRKLRLYINPSIMEELRARAGELGFTYDEFKKAFLEIEPLLRR
jgi:hypothetical protein